MLDGVRIKELEKELATTIVVDDYTGEDLIEKINQTMTQPFTEIAGEPNEPNHKN